jgi:hypothetical protein
VANPFCLWQTFFRCLWQTTTTTISESEPFWTKGAPMLAPRTEVAGVIFQIVELR